MVRSASRHSSARALSAAALLGVSLVLTAGPASASAPTPNEHNCAGTVVSGLAGPSFGALVSSAADAQSVDNFGLADCGQPPRHNP